MGVSWLISKPKTDEDSALVLLRGVDAAAPGLGKIGLNFLGQGFRSDEAGRRLGQVITEKISQLQQEAAHLQMYTRQLRQKNDELAGENQRLRNDPLRVRLENLQQQARLLSSRVELAETQLLQQEDAAQRQHKLHELEVNRLQVQIDELQRLVAKQHMQLIELLGDSFTRSESQSLDQ